MYWGQYRTKCCICDVWQWDLVVSVPGLRGEMQGGEGVGGGMALVFIQSPKNIFPKSLQTDCEATWKGNCFFLTAAGGKFKSNDWFLLSYPLYWGNQSNACSLCSAETGPFWAASYQNVFVAMVKNGKIFQASQLLKGKLSIPEVLFWALLLCFPLLRLVSWRYFLPHVSVRIDAGSLNVCCVWWQHQALRAEKLLWDSVQPVPWESVRQDTRKRDSWKGRSIPSRGRKEIQLKKISLEYHFHSRKLLC